MNGVNWPVIGGADTDHIQAQQGAVVLLVEEEALGHGVRSNHTDTQLPRAVLWPQRKALEDKNKNNNTVRTTSVVCLEHISVLLHISLAIAARVQESRAPSGRCQA